MRHFGLIGHPLGHSFSKAYFTAKFEREGLDCEYQNYDIPSLRAELCGAKQSNLTSLTGFNVTIPYKESIIPYLDELDPTAKEIGAVNTVKALPDGRLKGYNTDVIGFESSWIASAKGLAMTTTALVLGTGGASKAVQYVLRKHRIAFHLVSRNPEKGDYTYAQLTPDIIKEHLLIINTTPVGMAPNIGMAPDIPYEAISDKHLLIDLIYNPEETLFLRHGKKHGANTVNGLTMLYSQAEASWKIWNDSP